LSYWYLATPYTLYKDGITAAYQMAAKESSLYVKEKIPVFSPIVHCHPIAIYGDIDPLDVDLWVQAQIPMLDSALGLIVVMADGWTKSKGTAFEIEYMTRRGKTIWYTDEGKIPITLTYKADMNYKYGEKK
jgi:nucleoside 2-deoxyribosyltransferase